MSKSYQTTFIGKIFKAMNFDFTPGLGSRDEPKCIIFILRTYQTTFVGDISEAPLKLTQDRCEIWFTDLQNFNA